MRILYIHQYFCTPQGSSGTRSYEQARAMTAAGHQVTILTSSAQLRPEEIPPGDGLLRRGRVAGVDCIVLTIPYHQTMGAAGRILSFLKFMAWCCWIVLTDKRPDVIYATSTPLTVGIPAMAAKLARNVPYAFEVRDLWPDVPMAMGILRPGPVTRLLKSAERAIYRRAEFLVAVNDDVARRMTLTVGRPRPMVVAPNACDVDLFRPDRDGSAFRREHGLEGKLLCVHTGTMGRVNGLDCLLDAAAALRDDERVRFVLIGEGKEKPHLQQRAADERLTNVLILPAAPKTDLADVLATAEVGLMTVSPIPVLQWNCANKFFDYLAAGLPIVLNYQGWQGDLLARNTCGLSAPQGDLDGFVSAIRRLADEAELRAQLGANARELAETHLNRKTVVAGILKAMDEMKPAGVRAS